MKGIGILKKCRDVIDVQLVAASTWNKDPKTKEPFCDMESLDLDMESLDSPILSLGTNWGRRLCFLSAFTFK